MTAEYTFIPFEPLFSQLCFLKDFAHGNNYCYVLGVVFSIS